jgi:hypothetical protein
MSTMLKITLAICFVLGIILGYIACWYSNYEEAALIYPITKSCSFGD